LDARTHQLMKLLLPALWLPSSKQVIFSRGGSRSLPLCLKIEMSPVRHVGRKQSERVGGSEYDGQTRRLRCWAGGNKCGGQ